MHLRRWRRHTRRVARTAASRGSENQERPDSGKDRDAAGHDTPAAIERAQLGTRDRIVRDGDQFAGPSDEATIAPPRGLQDGHLDAAGTVGAHTTLDNSRLGAEPGGDRLGAGARHLEADLLA